MKTEIAVLAAIHQGHDQRKLVIEATGLSPHWVTRTVENIQQTFGMTLTNGKLAQYQRLGIYGKGIFAGADTFWDYLASLDLEHFRLLKELPEFSEVKMPLRKSGKTHG